MDRSGNKKKTIKEIIDNMIYDCFTLISLAFIIDQSHESNNSSNLKKI